MSRDRTCTLAPAVERRAAVALRLGSSATAGRPQSAVRSLQRQLGNRGTQARAAQIVARAAAPGVPSAGAMSNRRLAVSQPGDACEREAEHLAAAIMRMPEPASTISNSPRLIAFGAGQYAPELPEGQHLLAHELTHVVQQRDEQIQRAPGDILDDIGEDIEDLGKGLGNDVEEQVRQQLRALGALPGTGAVFKKSGCPKNFCNPYADVSLAKTNLVFAAPVLLAGIAKVVSPRVVPLWTDYLFGGSSPQNLTSSFGADFTASKTTADTTAFIVSQLKIEIAANHKAILTSTPPVTIDLTPRMPKTLAAIDNQKHPHAMDFNKISEIPGNIAGGIGKDQLSNKVGAKPSPFNDDRTATVTAQFTRTATGIQVKPNIVYKIHDTLDLCPGNCGAVTEQDATIPLSRFEATGLSGDVPFEVEFPAPAASLGAFDIPIAVPVKPKGGGKPKGPSKGKTPSKSKGGVKTALLSEPEPKEPLALEEIGSTAGSRDEFGPGFMAGAEIA